ncbi:Retinol dehydrogenase 8 [Colletotrichum orbiculare MAFF 240422]|uniref:Retinol dehydrogenase 8 n=1 Tax=Colletotrichum orbiculare (strain 104-T / ATCC 96160 / CBS 514.97 / LARS 414 / MAFF 240422) TaxID=1213857 RepID=A0A484FQI7_COLOR|nr:Retinol dehydrogenase 8 [Colletotrichum orbiculare MAFF 240422]
MSKPLTVPNHPLTWLITGQWTPRVATFRNPGKTPKLVQQVEAPGGQWLKLDVDDLASGDLVNYLERNGSHVDVLVNNAGWSIHGPAEGFTEEETRSQMDTVFFGPCRLTRAVAPFMRKRRPWTGLSEVLAKELSPLGVRVLAVQLGTFDTNMGPTAKFSSNPIPADYEESLVGRMCQMMAASATEGFPADGDHLKASRVIYEVVTATGVGVGKENQRMPPLGRDLAKRVDDVVAGYQASVQAFRDVCTNIYLENKQSATESCWYSSWPTAK